MEMKVFTKRKLANFLSELESVPIEMTLYFEPDSFLEDFKKLSWPKIISDPLQTIGNDENLFSHAKQYNTGAVIFLAEKGAKNYVILPPFPISENKSSFGFDPSLLYQGFERRFKRGVILVRWGEYSIGVFDGDQLITSKTDTCYIQKLTKKGGRSQKRYAKRTEEQKQNFLKVVVHRIEEKFGPYQLDSIFFGGNKLILNPLIKECDYLNQHSDQISNRILNVRYASRETLDNILEEIEKSIIFSH